MTRIKRCKESAPACVLRSFKRRNSTSSLQKPVVCNNRNLRLYRKRSRASTLTAVSRRSPSISGARRRAGNAFSKLLWSQYEDYQAALQRSVLPVLREKEAHDAQFVTLCKMSKGAVKYTLHDFLHQPVSQNSMYSCLFPARGHGVKRDLQ